MKINAKTNKPVSNSALLPVALTQKLFLQNSIELLEALSLFIIFLFN